MTIALLIALSIPIVFACLDINRDYFPFHVMVTGGCAALLLISGQRMDQLALVAGLFCSIAGDWFLHNKARNERFFLYGVGGFLLAHICYLWYILEQFSANAAVWGIGLALFAAYGVFIPKRVLPNVSGVPLKAAVCAYTVISVAVFSLSFGLNAGVPSRILFSLGIGCIVFSDTLIALSDFAGEKRLAKWIMPTYYACHVLITASALAGAL